MTDIQQYVQWFRAVAPYIKAHRKKTFVVQISDNIIDSDRFIGLIHDIALLNHLGIKLVLLHGSRHRIDNNLAQNNIKSRFNRNIRISDAESLPYIIQAINEVKTQLESHLSMGLPNTPMSGSEISLVSGNFVTGMPLGVIDGIDMQHSGKVRDVKHGAINKLLDQNHIILLSNIGYSKTGEIFNLPAEELASKVAQALCAEKLIYVNHSPLSDKKVKTLTTEECESIKNMARTPAEMKNLLQHAIDAINGQVERVHIIDQPVDGGLLLELFTRDGCGTMITNNFYEGIRAADINDIGGILRLIRPLEDSGILVERSKEQLELEINFFQVMEKDGMVIACVAFIPDQSNNTGEVACLAVHEDYRRAGLGQQLLKKSEIQAAQLGIRQLFILTTRTSHWFIENGFIETPDFPLPTAKQKTFNPQRRSKVFVKNL